MLGLSAPDVVSTDATERQRRVWDKRAPMYDRSMGLMEKLMPRVKRGGYVLIPTSERTRGHGTHSLPAVWGSYLADFLKTLSPPPSTNPQHE